MLVTTTSSDSSLVCGVVLQSVYSFVCECMGMWVFAFLYSFPRILILCTRVFQFVLPTGVINHNITIPMSGAWRNNYTGTREFSVAVRAELFHHDVELFVGQRLSEAGQKAPQLGRRRQPVVLVVEQGVHGARQLVDAALLAPRHARHEVHELVVLHHAVTYKRQRGNGALQTPPPRPLHDGLV